jgi:hypothetical protein
MNQTEIPSVVTNKTAVHFSTANDIMYCRHKSLSSEWLRMLREDRNTGKE